MRCRLQLICAAAVAVLGGCDHGLNEPPQARNDTAVVAPGGLSVARGREVI